MFRTQLLLPPILQDPLPTYLLSRSTTLPSDVIFLRLNIVIIFIEKMTSYCLEHVFLTPRPYWLTHNTERVFPKKIQSGRSINKEHSIIKKYLLDDYFGGSFLVLVERTTMHFFA